MTSSPFVPRCCPLVISHWYEVPFFRHGVFVTQFNLSDISIYSNLYNISKENLHEEWSVFRGSMSLLFINKTFMQVQILWILATFRLPISYSRHEWKREAAYLSLGRKVKGEHSCDVLLALHFWRNILMQFDDNWKTSRLSMTKMTLARTSNGCFLVDLFSL